MKTWIVQYYLRKGADLKTMNVLAEIPERAIKTVRDIEGKKTIIQCCVEKKEEQASE